MSRLCKALERSPTLRGSLHDCVKKCLGTHPAGAGSQDKRAAGLQYPQPKARQLGIGRQRPLDFALLFGKSRRIDDHQIEGASVACHLRHQRKAVTGKQLIGRPRDRWHNMIGGKVALGGLQRRSADVQTRDL